MISIYAMAVYFNILKFDIRHAHATIPTISARKMEISDIKKVDFNPSRKMGRY